MAARVRAVGRDRCASVVLVVSLVMGPLPVRAAARPGTLAVVNIGPAGDEVAARCARAVSAQIGTWARQPGVEAYLLGRPSPGALPVGDAGRDLVRLVERARTERAATRSELGDLGRVLGVDYLLLIRVRASTFVARLFSVHRQSYAPSTLEAPLGEVERLRGYVREALVAGEPRKGTRWRWWVWGIAAALAAVTVGLALSGRDETSGDLRIRVSR